MVRISIPLYVNLAAELEDYLKLHTQEIPEGIDKNTMRVLCEAYLIRESHNFLNLNPNTETFEWDVRFGRNEPDQTTSHTESRKYCYEITYRAIFQGERGIVKAVLMK